MVRFLIVLLTLLGTAWLVVGALLAPVVPGGWGMIAVGVLLLTVLPLALFIGMRARRRYPGALLRLLVFRVFWYAQLLLILGAIAGLVGALAGWPFGRAGFAGRLVLGVVAGAAALIALIGYVDSRRLVVRRLRASFPHLPPGLDGLRVVQLSDLHVGPHTSRRFLDRVARLVRDAEPHLVAVTGDLIDDYDADVAHYAAALGGLAAPLGVFAIPGNHDVYAGWAAVRARLDALPLTVLVNETRVVRRDGAALAVVGTGDPAGRMAGNRDGAAPDIPRALAAVPPGAFVLALAHNPALWPALAERGVPLTLSGHTHWGQFALPRRNWSLAAAFLDLAMGIHRRGDSVLYISPGTNYWGIPFRLGTPPEVTVVTLRVGEIGIAEGD